MPAKGKVADIKVRDHDDWVTITIDGHTQFANHSLSTRDVVELLEHLGYLVDYEAVEGEEEEDAYGEDEE